MRDIGFSFCGLGAHGKEEANYSTSLSLKPHQHYGKWHIVLVAAKRMLPGRADLRIVDFNVTNEPNATHRAAGGGAGDGPDSGDSSAAGQMPQAAHAAEDGAPFYKPSYFKEYNINDELLRRNAVQSALHVPGKVRRISKQTRQGRRGVYWYSEPDARACWPDRFKKAGPA